MVCDLYSPVPTIRHQRSRGAQRPRVKVHSKANGKLKEEEKKWRISTLSLQGQGPSSEGETGGLAGSYYIYEPSGKHGVFHLKGIRKT